MKWIIGGLILWYFYTQSQNPASMSTANPAPGTAMTNQLTSTVQQVTQTVGTIAVDITGEPTIPANNSVAVAQPSSQPIYPPGRPVGANPIL